MIAEAELVDQGGGKQFVHGAALDVTDERAGFDSAPVGMLVAEPEQLRLIRVNDALCSILQRSREELLGQRIVDLTHPDDRFAVSEKRQALIAGVEQTHEPEKRYLLPNGDAVWVAVYITALHNSDGSVRAFSSHVIDITERRARGAELQAARVGSLRRLAIASEYRDNETYEHTERVGSVSVAIGRALGMHESQLDLLRGDASLHDIGKVGISDAILLKPGRLTPEERRVMERHTLIGADILSGGESPVLWMAREIAVSHHERWDGEGYPNNLTAATIPLVGRIVGVADVFDALCHERPYKEAWPLDRAIALINDESGSHFDPAVVAAFNTLDHPSLSTPPRPVEIDQPSGEAHALIGAALAAGSTVAGDEPRLAQVDPLTGALGRSLGTVALGREINRARHGSGKLVLASIDVDGLRHVNERRGRAGGDLLLRQVVDATLKHLRSYDPVVRVGGDEFVCALLDATAEDVRCRFERIQATIDEAQPGASISFGLAVLRPEDSLEELTARGQQALCVSKERYHQGRQSGEPPPGRGHLSHRG